MPRWMRIALVGAILCSLPAVIHAQDSPRTYLVTGSQPINARACPRLACAIVHTFDPGTALTVSATVAGDALADSDQWLQVELDGSTVYVHSTLAELVPPTPEPTLPSKTEDPALWVEHTGTGFSLDTPPGWVAADGVYSNGVLLDALAKLYEMDSDDFIQNVALTSETPDLYLIDMENGTLCEVWHADRGTGRLSPTLLKEMMSFQFEQEGHTVTAAEPVALPAGEAVRLDLTQAVQHVIFSSDLEHVVYGVVGTDQIYYLGFTVPPEDLDETARTLLDGVAASFRMES